MNKLLSTKHGLKYWPLRGGPTKYGQTGELIPPSTLESLQHVQTEHNDVFLLSYPKSGQHLLKKMCLELVRQHDGANTNPIYSTADIGMDAIPLRELFFTQHGQDGIDQRKAAIGEDLNFWWTHSDYGWFSENKHPNTKAIVMSRDPKAVLVSYWHFLHNIGAEWGGFEKHMPLDEFLPRFVAGTLRFGCYYQWTLGWFDAFNGNCKEFNADGKRMLWLYYEDALSDPVTTATKIKNFLFSDDDKDENIDVERVAELSKFESVKNEIKVRSCDVLILSLTLTLTRLLQRDPQSFAFPKFFRSGTSDDWKNHMTEAQSDLIDEITLLKWADRGQEIKYYKELALNYN